MASNTPRHGHDLRFVSQPPSALECILCKFVARDPQQMDCCGRVYCNACISEHKKHSDMCPECLETGKSFVDKKSDREIKALKVKCNNLDNGCQWTGELHCLEEHLLVCDYELVPCTNDCREDGQVVRLFNKDLEEHLESKCPRRQFKCPHCLMFGEYKERVGEHLNICAGVSITCSNAGCTETFQRWRYTAHKLTCDYEPVPCKYAEVGCEERPLRKDLKKHEEDDQLHCRITTKTVLKQMSTIKQLDTNIKRLSNEIEQLRKQIASPKSGGFTFRISPFSVAQKNGSTLSYSPPCYSSKRGYKLCIGVDTNNGDGEGTHVSVYVYLMKGDNDDSLTWPFTGTVTVELLNQLEDKNHHKMTIKFSTDSRAGRVVTGEAATNGYGCTEFISHADLAYKSRKRCQYLKDDTLVFRVSIRASDYEPWLEC